MPLTKAEAVQITTAIQKLHAFNIAGHGHMVARDHVVDLIDLYTEETIDAINSGKTTIKYTDASPK
ncbi:hypothetical protein LCGC14_1309340 [marine sediment metagenome]|uniref:Uncharacterized protein n=1 Tax=marine sediment metagenome TaxID=412755 RepID=A0A0F9KMW7_9ZZZZ